MSAHLRSIAFSSLALLLSIASFSTVPAALAEAPAQGQRQATAIETPLTFEPNEGQESGGVRFAAAGQGYTLQLKERSAVLQFSTSAAAKADLRHPGVVKEQPAAVAAAPIELEMLNSNPLAEMSGAGKLAGVANYVPASDAKSWHEGVAEYGRVEYRDVYPGTGLVFYAHQRSLEYDFQLKPGADATKVLLAIRGAEAVHLDGDGNLVMSSGGRDIRFLKPVAYQPRKDGGRDTVAAAYSLTTVNTLPGAATNKAAWLLSFTVGAHDAARELVIDPVLSYGQILPGVDNNIGAITTDSAGNLYVVGQNQSRGFYLAKFNSAGTNVFTTVVGSGTATSVPTAVAVDAAGKIYVGGYANTGLPATANAYLNYTGPHTIAFAAVFPSTGAAPSYLSYFGGTKSTDYGSGIAVDTTGHFYLTGDAGSLDFPTTSGAYATTIPDPGSYAVFVAKFNPAATGAASLVYSTLLGSVNSQALSSGIAVDSSGDAFITATSYIGYPVTTGAINYTGQYATNFSYGAYITKLNPTGSALVYSTFLGPGVPTAIQVDTNGDAYTVGQVLADDFPTTTGAYQVAYPGGFASELNPAGTAFVYSTFLSGPSGGTSPEAGDTVFPQDVVIPAGCASNCAASISGYTYASDFPAINAVQATTAVTPAAFVVTLAGGGASASLSSYLGGVTATVTVPFYDPIGLTPSVALDASGDLYFGANMSGSDFPTTLALPSPLSSSYLAKIAPAAGTLVIADPVSVNFDNYGVYEVVGVSSTISTNQNYYAAGNPVQVTLRNLGSSPITISSIAISPATEFFETDQCSLTIPAGGTCVLNLSETPTAAGKRAATLTVTSNASNGPLKIALSGTAIAAGFLQTSTVSMDFPDQAIGTVSAQQMFTLTNIGQTVVNLNAISPTPLQLSSQYGNGTDYQVLSDCPAQIKAGASCTVGVTFDPLAAGIREAYIQTSSDSPVNPDIYLYGVGTVGTNTGTVSLSATALNFNTQLINSTSAQQTITVVNSSSAPVSVYSVSIATKNQATGSDFAIVGGNCYSTSPVVVRPQSNCTIGIRYTPTITGTETGAVTITDSAAGSPQVVTLSGIGVASAQALEFSPGNYAFPDQPVGSPSTAVTVYVYNTSTAPVTIDRLLVSGDYQISSSNCPGALLKPGPAAGVEFTAGCTVRLTFTPSAVGARPGTLSFVDTVGATQVLNLTGNGITATGGVLVEPGALVFPVQAVGSTSATQHVNIFNPGNAFTTINSITTTGDFAIANVCNTTPFTLNLLSNCGVDISFTPTSATNPRAGTLVVNSTGGTATTTLTGTAVTATMAVGLTPTSLNFGSVQNGVQSFIYNVYMRNTGTAPVTLTSIATSGDYQNNGGTCGFNGSQLAPGTSCYVQVALTPTAAGTRAGTLTLVDSAGTQTAALTGVGSASIPSVQLSPSGGSFNQQSAGTTSGFQYFYVVNNASTALAISTAAITTGGSAYVIATGGDHCSGITIGANGGSCNVVVQFSPAAAGYITGALTFTNAAKGTYVVPLAGYAAADASSSYVDPTELNFPSQVLATTSAAFPFSVINTGNLPLTVGALTGVNTIIGTTATGVFSTNGTQGGGDSCSGATVQVNSRCTVYVTFTPTAVGAATGSVKVPVTYANSTTATFTVTFNGIGAAVKDLAELSPAALNFSDEALNAVPGAGADTAQVITLDNLGNLPLTVGTLTSTDVVVGATTKGDFSTSGTFGGYDGCTGATVAPRSNCQVTVAFTPAATGAKAGSIVFPVTYGDSTATKLTATLSGKGIADTSTVVVSPSSGVFDVQVVGTTSPNNLTFTMSNTGNQPIKITTSVLTAGFSFSTGGDGCSGTTLAINSYCQITVAFSPTKTGVTTGTLTIPDNATGNPHKVTLTGTGIAASQQIALSQTAVNFGSQLVATKSAPVLVYVTNQSSATVNVTSTVLSGTNASDFLESDNCEPAIGGLQYCTISVTFSPATASTGVRTATVTEIDSATGSPRVITLTGTGIVATPGAAFYPSSLNFGTQALSTKSAAQTFSLTNTGTANLVVKTVVSSNPTEFPITSNGCASKTLAAGTNCLVSVQFDPNAGSTQSATITFTDNVGNVANATQTVAVTGVSVGVPAATLSPASLAFGSEGVGVASASQVITLKDSGTDTLAIASIAITGTNATDFTQTNTCGKSIVAAASCAITVVFNPKAVGARSASITVTDNAGNVTGTVQTAALSGTGTGVAKVAFSPTSEAFGSANVGVTSAGKVVTVSNPGTAPLTISKIAVAGTNPGDFAETTTCTSSLAAAGTCTITVTFTPTAAGARAATIAVTDTAAASPQSVTLTGTGVGAATATVSPTSLTFAAQAVGVVSAAKTVTVTNSGSAALAIASFKVGGTNATDFKAASTTCTGSIAVAASCTISVTFTPAAAGARTASITITDNSGNVTGATQTVALSGTGTGTPKVTISPASFAFPSTAVGSAVGPMSVTLKNSGTGALNISSIALSGANAGDFLEFDTCVPSVAVGGSCEIALYFLPKGAGARAASVIVTDNASPATQTIAVTGTGIGTPTASLSAASLTFATTKVGSLSAGQSVTLTNTGNVALTVTSVALSGTNPADFMDFSTCSSVGAGDTCVVAVFFEPAATGKRVGTITITDNSGGTAGSKQTIALTGTGD